nr:MAG TPA: hypothetical protein [Caudoviricetes sp.]
MGSYIGAIATIVVMVVTFKKSDKENKRLVELQKRQHDIDVQTEKIKKIVHVLLLDEYYFLDANSVCESIHRFFIDLNAIGLDTLNFKYTSLKDVPLVDELLKLQEEEVAIYNLFVKAVPHVDSHQKADELIKVFLDTGKNLHEVANSRREIIHLMYDGYLKETYEHYYE